MTDVLVVSLEAWDDTWRRNQHLVAQLLRRDPDARVLFVEPPTDPVHDALQRRRPHLGSGLRPGPAPDGVADGHLHLLQPTKWLPRRLDPGVDARLAGRVVRTAASLGFSDPLLWVNAPWGARVLEQTSWPTLYDITDDWLSADRTDGEHARLVDDEHLLLSRAQEVVVCSPHLQRTKTAAGTLTLIPNAVDVAAYRGEQPRPGDLPARSAVYVGTLHEDRLDVDLCVETARAIEGRGRLVLVGPAPLTTGNRQRLDDAGVLVLGPRAHTQVPAYLRHADVLVVPHLVNAFTESLDPIKAYEYRAAARPVVSTPVPGFREPATGVVNGTGTAFVDAVVGLVTSAPHEDLTTGADVPSWEQRSDELATVLSRLAGGQA